MAEFRIEIAGKVFSVTSLFESTKDYCRNYLSDRNADDSIAVSPEDLVKEQQFLDEEAREEGMKRRKFTDPFLERTAIQRKVARYLLEHDTLLFHGSAVAVDGKGYLFTAACGTGKSTHTRFWREVFGSRAVMVNDDKPFLKITERGVLMYGAPWSGKHGLDTNICVPLQGLCLLTRGAENRIVPLAPEAALPMLEHQSCGAEEPALLPTIRQLANHLSRNVPLWQMACTKDPEAAKIAFEAMSE